MKFISEFKDIISEVEFRISSPGGFFFNRIGGSDTNFMVDYYINNGDLSLMNKTNIDLIYRYNGYYDFELKNENLHNYYKILFESYCSSDGLISLCNSNWITSFFPGLGNKIQVSEFEKINIHSFFNKIQESCSNDICAIPYDFIEQGLLNPFTLFSLFKKILSGKRVLVISPFGRSFQFNFSKRKNFFKNYDYPDFELQVMNTPITYKGLPNDSYPHNNWLQTKDALIKNISEFDFDIALLSCGSYAMPLGDYISKSMGRKSIYVGGVLQLYFGVTGRRYDNVFFNNYMNLENFITPLERADYEKFNIFSNSAASEAFNAYF